MVCEKDYQLQALHAVKNQIPNYLNPANQNILWRSKAVVLALPPSVVALILPIFMAQVIIKPIHSGYESLASVAQ